MTILFDLPPKPPLRWASDYKLQSYCYICNGTDQLLAGWPKIMCPEPPPWTTVCRDCVILWREGCGTIEEIKEQRKKDNAKTT